MGLNDRDAVLNYPDWWSSGGIKWSEVQRRVRIYRDISAISEQGPLFCIMPANPSTCKDKRVFFVDGIIVRNVLNPDDTFSPGQAYIDKSLVPFDAENICAANLGFMFSKEVVDTFHLKPSMSQGVIFKREDVQHDKEKAALAYLSNKKVNSTKPTKEVKPTKEEKKMSKVKSTAVKVKNVNVDAAKVTARLAAGKALNTAVQEKIVPKLPLMVRGYAGTEVGKVVLANAVAAGLTYYAPENEKAALVSQAMVEAAMVDLMAVIDIEGLVREFLNSDAAQRIVE